MQSIRFKKIITNKYTLFFSFIFFVALSLVIREKVFASTVVHVSWVGQNTTNCRVPAGLEQPGWSGAQASPNGIVDIPRSNFNLAGANSYTFTLRCDDANTAGVGIQYSKTIVITNNVALSFTSGGAVNPYITLSYSADEYFVDSNNKTIIRWNFSDPNGVCTASGAWSGSKAASGIYNTSRNNNMNNPVTRTYGISCTGQGTTITGTFDIWFDTFVNSRF